MTSLVSEPKQFIHGLQLQELKVAFCNHCLASGLVNKDLEKKDRDILMQEHWKKFWDEICRNSYLIPKR